MHVLRKLDVHDFVAKAMVIASSLSSAVRPWEMPIDLGSTPRMLARHRQDDMEHLK